MAMGELGVDVRGVRIGLIGRLFLVMANVRLVWGRIGHLRMLLLGRVVRPVGCRMGWLMVDVFLLLQVGYHSTVGTSLTAS